LLVQLNHHKISLTSIMFSPYLKESLKNLSLSILLIIKNGNLILSSTLSFMTQPQVKNISERTPPLKLQFWMKISLVSLDSNQLKSPLQSSKIELISRLLEVKVPVGRSAAWLELSNSPTAEDL
jgi:hypothetical protein